MLLYIQYSVGLIVPQTPCNSMTLIQTVKILITQDTWSRALHLLRAFVHGISVQWVVTLRYYLEDFLMTRVYGVLPLVILGNM